MKYLEKFEDENLEFKSQYSENINKEVIAFANTGGGKVITGVDDIGNVIGLEDIDETLTKLTNSIRDSIEPDITMHVKHQPLMNKTIETIVEEGTSKPYFLKSKGINSKGVFVRQGSSSVPASNEQIRKMINNSENVSFEEKRSIEQELTFNGLSRFFSKNGIELVPSNYPGLGLINNETQLYTNLAFILSDQNTQTIKIAVYKDPENTIFIDRRELFGSIFDQFSELETYLSLINKTSSTFENFLRIDTKDYPEEALREAILNAIVHRDYSLSSSIQININDQFIEVLSYGGLVPGLDKEDLGSGISILRNRYLGSLFYRLRLIESYGTGLKRINSIYSKYDLAPKIEITPNTFKIILPNINADKEIEQLDQNNNSTQKSLKKKTIFDERKERLLEYLSVHQKISQPELENYLSIKQSQAYDLVKKLKDQNLITVEGRGRSRIIRIKA